MNNRPKFRAVRNREINKFLDLPVVYYQQGKSGLPLSAVGMISFLGHWDRHAAAIARREAAEKKMNA